MVASVHNYLRRESYNWTCYYRNVEKNIVENDTLTDLPGDLISEEACPELCYLEDEVRMQLYWALEQLPELQRKFIYLHFFLDIRISRLLKYIICEKAQLDTMLRKDFQG